MSFFIFPSDDDVGTTQPGGGVVTEAHVRDVIRALAGRRNAFVQSGMLLTNPSGLNIQVGAGVALCDGFIITIVGSETHVATASVTRYLWIKPNYTAGKVSGRAFVETATAQAPATDHALLGKFTSGVSTITSFDTVDRVVPSQVHTGRYTGDNAASRDIFIGFTPRLVVIIQEVTSGEGSVHVGVIVTDADTLPLTTQLGFRLDDAALIAWTWSSLLTIVPRIIAGGFRIGGSSVGNLNNGGFIGRWFAI